MFYRDSPESEQRPSNYRRTAKQLNITANCDSDLPAHAG